MKTARVRDLRKNRLKRGTPFVRVVPKRSARSFFGGGADTVEIPDDIDDPISIAWRAARQ